MVDEKTAYTRSGRQVKHLGGGQLTPEQDAEADAIMAASESENGIRVNFRWGKEQLEQVKAVADQIGIPYQTYMKQCIYKQCMQDAAMIGFGKVASTGGYAEHGVAATICRLEEQQLRYTDLMITAARSLTRRFSGHTEIRTSVVNPLLYSCETPRESARAEFLKTKQAE